MMPISVPRLNELVCYLTSLDMKNVANIETPVQPKSHTIYVNSSRILYIYDRKHHMLQHKFVVVINERE